MSTKVSAKGKKLAQLRKLKLEETSLKAAIAMFEEQLNRLKLEELNLTEKQREQMVSNITKSLHTPTAATRHPDFSNDASGSVERMESVENVNEQELILSLRRNHNEYDEEFDEEECLLQL